MTRSQGLRLVWRDATTGVPLVFGVLSGLVAVGLGLAASHPESPQWADRLNLALLVCAFTGPLAFAGAAAHTGSLHRTGLLDLAATGGRGRYGFARVAAAASWAWALAGVALTTVVVLLAVVPPRPPLTVAAWLLPVTAVILTTLCSLAGSAAGARFRSTLVPAVGAAVTFAWLYGATLLPDPANLISPVDSGSSYQPFTEPNSPLYGGVALLLAAGAAVAWALLQNRPVLIRIAGCSTAVLIIAGGFLVSTSGGERVVMLPPPAQPACTTSATADTDTTGTAGPGRVTVCMWPGMADQLPVVLAAATSVTDQIGPYLPVPATFIQEGLSPQPDVLMFRTSTLDVEVGLNEQRIVDALLPECASGALDNPAREQLVDWARYRLRAAFSEFDADSAAAAALPLTQQRQWVTDKLTQSRRC